MTLITEQYFFICSSSLSSCFFPFSSCHFLLYLVKAFFLLLYLGARKGQIQPRSAAAWVQFTEFTPVSIKSAFALVAQVLCKDAFEGAQAVDRLDVPHHPDHDDRRGFNNGDRFYLLSFRLLCWHRKPLSIVMRQLYMQHRERDRTFGLLCSCKHQKPALMAGIDSFSLQFSLIPISKSCQAY